MTDAQWKYYPGLHTAVAATFKLREYWLFDSLIWWLGTSAVARRLPGNRNEPCEIRDQS